MSFLNPVNEPVLRFKSTDAGAPQINYNSRVAGDVKAVLKACLVTGYGAKESAGWSIANEVDHVAEFVSPSAAMSDYRLGIDDTSTSNTIWYYQYQDARTNPVNNNPAKNISYINKTSGQNGWQLIVTSRGVYFVENLYHTSVNDLVARITWLGQLKTALSDSTINISYFCVGTASPVTNPSKLLENNSTSDPNKTYKLGSFDVLRFSVVNHHIFATGFINQNDGGIDVISDVYLATANGIVAHQSGLLFKTVADPTSQIGVYEDTLDGRNVLNAVVTYSNNSNASFTYGYAKTMLIRLDYWEY